MNIIRLALIILGISICVTATATTYFVTPAGAGTKSGVDWANAAAGTDLQTVINNASNGDQVWVACGTYTPTQLGDRSIAFSMKNGVTIYGGFQGTESLLSERSLLCGPCSILSGEIGVAGNSDNSYKVISNFNLNSTAIIDGFTIRDANDDRAPTLTTGLGGGIINVGSNGNNCSPTIRNCVISNNAATYGAGIFNDGFNGGNANPLISNCIITNNTAYDGGGGIDNFGLQGNASPTIINTIVYNNTANTAGGMYCWGGNTGGNSSPTIVNCAFVNNTATSGNAGGIIVDNTDDPCCVTSGSSNVTVKNSIFWGNTATLDGPQFFIKGNGTFNATYSIVDVTNQTGLHVISGAGTGNLATNPQFVSIANAIGADNCWFTSDDGLRLSNGADGIDAGDNTGLGTIDITGITRIDNGTVDIGPYENVYSTNVLWDGGAADNLWSSADNWSNDLVPTNSDDVILDNSIVAGAYSVQISADAEVANLTIDNGNVTLTMETNTKLDYTSITNNGSITLENGASLIPIGTGDISGAGFGIKRNKPIGQSKTYYNFFSSPVVNGHTAMLTGGKNIARLKEGAMNGSGQFENYTGNMQAGRGYIATNVTTALFTGTPNNGDITYTVSNAGDGYNLIGNPYPSAINAQDFVVENEGVTGPLASATLFLWDQQEKRDFNATQNFIAVNATGSSGYFSSGSLATTNIASCQSFEIQAAVSGDVKFTNAMRNRQNSDFKSSAAGDLSLKDAQYVWLAVYDAVKEASCLIALSETATLGKDFYYDAQVMLSNELSIVSNYKENHFSIQALPANSVRTEIPLTIASAANRDLKVVLAKEMDILPNQDILLWDKVKDAYFDLRNAEIAISQNPTTQVSDRYVLVLDAIGANAVSEVVKSALKWAKSDEGVRITSPTDGKILMHGVGGKLLFEGQTKNGEITIETSQIHGVVLVSFVNNYYSETIRLVVD